MVVPRLTAALDRASGVDSSALESLVNAHGAARKAYDDYEAYWDGRHSVRLTQRLKQFLANNGISTEAGGFRDNFCGVVVAAMASRLKITAFTVPGEKPPDTTDAVAGDPPKEGKLGPAAQYASDTWSFNRGDAVQVRVHENAAALGDSFVIVEWDPEVGKVRFAYNDPRLVRVEYDPGNTTKMLRASKLWTIDAADPTSQKVEASARLNVYYPDRIERYIRNGLIGGGNWRKFTDEATPGWPLWWTEDGAEGGEPLGIPIVHFANNDRGRTYGRSELADVIALQDALNKGVIDAMRLMDAQGWPQRYATGVDEVPNDDQNLQPGAILWSKSQNAKFGSFESAAATGLIELWNKVEEDIAAITFTPQHLFRVTGGAPSGEALKTSEAGLVRKVEQRQITFGNAWEDVQAHAARIARANGEGFELPDTGYAATWDSAETRADELQRIQAINSKEGISRRQRWREYGYTDEQIERMEIELEQEPNALDAALAGFDAGQGGGGQPRPRPGQQQTRGAPAGAVARGGGN